MHTTEIMRGSQLDYTPAQLALVAEMLEDWCSDDEFADLLADECPAIRAEIVRRAGA